MAIEAEDQETDADGQPHAPASGSGGKGLIIAFVAVVVLMETGMFFFLVPSADEVSALAEAKLIKSVQEGEAAAEEQASDENTVKEFNMGRYGETFSPIDTERSYRVEIDLYGADPQEESGKDEIGVCRKGRSAAARHTNENPQ